MSCYSHLSLEERIKLSAGLRMGKSLRSISRELGRHHSSLSREIKRSGMSMSSYRAENAHSLCQRRLGYNKINNNSMLRNYVVNGLRKFWSPEQISGRMRVEDLGFYACHETIYRYIYQDDSHKERLVQYLPRRLKNRRIGWCKKRSGKQELPHISNRLAPRSELGHWEADLVLFGMNKIYNIISLVERKSRYTKLLYNQGKYAKSTMRRIKKYIDRLPKVKRRSITFDRGREFTKYHILSTAGYFCDPASPHQKGTNENTNGRLRRFLPKNAKTTQVTPRNIQKIQNIMNNTPRKILGYKTPTEVFLENQK